MSDKTSNPNVYSPDPSLIEALASPLLKDTTVQVTPGLCVELGPEGEVLATSNTLPTQRISPAEADRALAAEYLRTSLETLVGLLTDLKKLAPATQAPAMYAAAGEIAQKIMTGSSLLYKLHDNVPGESKKGNPQHLHFHGTSAEMGEKIAARVKARKDRDGK